MKECGYGVGHRQDRPDHKCEAGRMHSNKDYVPHRPATADQTVVRGGNFLVANFV